MKKIQVLLLMLLLIVAIPVCCQAAVLSALRISSADVTSIDDIRAISWYSQTDGGSERYIFLPGEADASDLRIWFKGPNTMTVDGQRVKSGGKISLKPDSIITISNGAKNYRVHVMQAGQQGSVYLTTESGSLWEIDRYRTHIEKGAALVADADGTVYTSQKMESFRIRGNGSATFVKKSYQMKLTSKANLFGMGKSKTWLLISNYKDWTNLRNMLTYQMARYAGCKFTPECVYVNLYINHEYRGLYLFVEKLQVSPNRVDITGLEKATQAVNEKPLREYPIVSQTKYASPKKGRWYDIPNNPEDITGGYLMKIDLVRRYTKYEDEASYTTTKKIAFFFKEPDCLSKAQYDYITALLQSFEDAIHNSKGIDPKTKKHYTEIADFDSLVRKYMLEEVSANFDGSKCSQYFYKPSDSESTLLYAGPAWDYDSTWGSYLTVGTSQKLANSLFVGKADHYSWWAALYRKPEFLAAVKELWEDTYSHALAIILGEEEDPTGTLQSIDVLVDELQGSNAMDFIKWPYRRVKSNKAFGDATYKGNLDYFKKMVRMRLDFLKSVWD